MGVNSTAECQHMTQKRVRYGTRTVERWNRVFEAASAEPRRQLIVALLDRPQGHSVPLPESVADPDIPVDREVLRQELLHSHLPMLADMEFVKWDTDPFVAARGPRFDEIAVVFEALHSHSADIPDSLVVGCRRLERERRPTTTE